MYPSILLSVFLGVLSVSGVVEAIPIDERRSVAPLAGAHFDSRTALFQARSYGNNGRSLLTARQESNKKKKEKAAEAARLEQIKEENRKANELKAQQEKERLAKAQKAQEAADQKKKEEADATLKAQKEAVEKATKAKADKRVAVQAKVSVPPEVVATCGGSRVHKTAKLKEAITDALIRQEDLGGANIDAEQPKVFRGSDAVPTGGRLRDLLTRCPDKTKQLREWPIFPGDNLVTRFNPLAKDDPSTDRVIFTEDGVYCGIVAHPPSATQNDNRFGLCENGN